ncbi:MAG: RHS repeat domain-containing protein, partial [bacterium]
IIEAQDSSILAYYTQGQGLLSQRRNNTSYFYHYDGLGSTKALSDTNQNIQNTTIYDAWGNVLQSSGTVPNPYLYVGELSYYADSDAGMYLLTQRWYNPVIGRFVVRDPLSKSLGVKLQMSYIYAHANPVNFVDPSGLRGFWDWCWKRGCRTLPDGRVKCKSCIGPGCKGRPECPPRDLDKIIQSYIRDEICHIMKNECQLAWELTNQVWSLIEAPSIINQTFSPGGNCFNFFQDLCKYNTGDPNLAPDLSELTVSCYACCTDLYSAFGVTNGHQWCQSFCVGKFLK